MSIKRFFLYIATGVVFYAVMEFAFQVILFGNLVGFLLTIPLLEIPFLLFAFFTSKLVDKKFKPGTSDIIIFVFYGLLALILIEWIFSGNSPWSNPDAGQLTMVLYWGGGVILSRLFSDEDIRLRTIKKRILMYFIPYSIIFIIVGFLIPAGDLRFVSVIWMAIIGYNIMAIFYIWYFRIRYKIRKS